MAKKKNSLTPEQRLQEALVPESEWPYKIPRNWCWTPFNSISIIRTGKKDANYGSTNGAYPFFTCAEFPIRCDDFTFDCNAILLAGNGDISNISRYNGKFEAYQRTYVVEVNKPINLDYIYYYFKFSWVDYNKDKMYGTAIPYIRLGNLKEYSIPVPPSFEQQRIVDRIESLFSKLDEAKQKAQDVLDGFESRKAAILHKAFTGELTQRWRNEHLAGNTKWDLRKASDIFEYVTSGSRGWAKYYSENGDIFIRMGNLDHGTIELDLNDIQYVNLPTKAEGQRSKLKKNDILISITADIGMIGLVRELEKDAYINQHIAMARPVGNDNAEFIAWYLVSDVGLMQMRKMQRGATKVGLGLDDIRNLQLPMPCIEEQSEIVRILDDLLSKEQEAKETAESVLEQIDLIKKSILARAFRGELGTNDPTEESSVELLKETLEKED